MFGLGPVELTLLVAVVLLLFGGKRVASLLGSVGEGVKNFRHNLKADTDVRDEIESKSDSKSEK